MTGYGDRVITDWTDERIAALREYWAAGNSASQIAGLLGGGVTRSGVIGKVHRLNLPGGSSHMAARAAARPQPALVIRPKIMPKRRALSAAATPKEELKPAAPVVPTGPGVTIFELHSQTCRFPLWEHLSNPPVEEKRYCGFLCLPGDAWCGYHRQMLCDNTPRDRRRAPAALLNYATKPNAPQV